MHIDMVLKKSGSSLPPLEPGGIRYVVAENGVFLERRTGLFTTSCRVDDWAAGLAEHGEECELCCPPIPGHMVAQMLGFFRWAYELHGGEAVLLLLYDSSRRRFSWRCPPQEVHAWESRNRTWHTSSDISYTVPTAVPPGFVVFGDAHSHGRLAAYASHVDKLDEHHKDGLHIIAGYVDYGRPDFHIDFVMDTQRFALAPEVVFAETRVRPSPHVPQRWKKQVRIVRERYRFSKWRDRKRDWREDDEVRSDADGRTGGADR